jgi:hypothetical protein
MSRSVEHGKTGVTGSTPAKPETEPSFCWTFSALDAWWRSPLIAAREK